MLKFIEYIILKSISALVSECTIKHSSSIPFSHCNNVLYKSTHQYRYVERLRYLLMERRCFRKFNCK